jgi:hypothetical protein
LIHARSVLALVQIAYGNMRWDVSLTFQGNLWST